MPGGMDKAMNPLNLRFAGDLERQFQDEYYEKSLPSFRLSVLLGTILYCIFGILDAQIFPETTTITWFIRYVIVLPLCASLILFSYSRAFKNYMQPAVVFVVVASGAGIVAMMVVVQSPTNYFHYAGLLLVLMYVYTFSKLRFLTTCLAAWTIVLLYEIAAIGILKTPLPTLLNDNFFYLSANLIGMFSSYHREKYMRKDFVQNRLVKELEERKHILEREKILRDLHDGLGGITTNIRLLAEMGRSATAGDDIKKTFAIISELCREGLAEIKGFMQSLDAREISWHALAAELRSLGIVLLEPHGIGFSMTSEIDGAPGKPDSLLWLNLFRIYKEALTNIVKHAGGKNVAIHLAVTGEGLALRIHDDGGGIHPGAPGGRGMSNMRKRAEEIGGSLRFSGGQGTTVSLEAPLSSPERGRSLSRSVGGELR